MTLTSKFKKDISTLRAAANKEIFLDVNILDKIETDIIDRVKQVPVQKLFQHGFR